MNCLICIIECLVSRSSLAEETNENSTYFHHSTQPSLQQIQVFHPYKHVKRKGNTSDLVLLVPHFPFYRSQILNPNRFKLSLHRFICEEQRIYTVFLFQVQNLYFLRRNHLSQDPRLQGLPWWPPPGVTQRVCPRQWAPTSPESWRTCWRTMIKQRDLPFKMVRWSKQSLILQLKGGEI